MKALILGAISLLMFPTVSRAGAASQYLGYTVINQNLRERIMTPDSTFNLGKYLGENRSEPRANGGLLALLGTYVGGDLDAGFRNGDPNPMNSILWYVALGGLARDFAKQCDTPPSDLPLSPEFKTVLMKFCTWPNGAQLTDDQLYSFWNSLVGFDAPNDEFQAWRDFARSPEMVAMPAKAAIQSLGLAALFNPYFLLRP